MPTLQDLIARTAAMPSARSRVLRVLDALEASIPARRVAEVGAVLVGGITRGRVAYGGRAAEAVLPPERLERLVVAVAEVRCSWWEGTLV